MGAPGGDSEEPESPRCASLKRPKALACAVSSKPISAAPAGRSGDTDPDEEDEEDARYAPFPLPPASSCCCCWWSRLLMADARLDPIIASRLMFDPLEGMGVVVAVAAVVPSPPTGDGVAVGSAPPALPGGVAPLGTATAVGRCAAGARGSSVPSPTCAMVPAVIAAISKRLTPPSIVWDAAMPTA
jgi:hypothetical protein